MSKRFSENTIIFLSILKWVPLAAFAGIVVGAVAAGFLKLLQYTTSEVGGIHYYFLFLPVALFLSAWLVIRFAKSAEGHGTEKVIEAIHKTDGKISWQVVPVKVLATLITLSFGGSAGKEGPTAQIGAGITSLFSQLLRLNSADRRKLVICGISAGFAAVFGLPISGAIFGVEVLFVGAILYDVLLPSFISGILAYEIAVKFGVHYYNNMPHFVPVFTNAYFIVVLISGLFFGACSLLTIEIFEWTNHVAHKINMYKPLKGLIGGVFLIALTLLFSQKYLGLGLSTIENNLSGGSVNWYDFLLKIIFTSITLGFGGSGGVITSVFFIGSCAGVLFGQMLHLDTSTFAAIGMVSMVAGSANTPIAASIMSIEMFGPQMGIYGSAACIISYLITGHRSIYPSQVISETKSENLHGELGGSLDSLSKSSFHYSSRDPITNFIITSLKTFNEKVKDLIHKIENWRK